MTFRKVLLCWIGLCVILAVGCGGDDDPVTPPDDGGEIDSYLTGLPKWHEFSEPQLPSDEPTGPTEVSLDQIGDDDYICSRTPCSITETPEDVVTFNAGGDILWPGALIQGDSYLGGIGTMKELPIRQRAPLTVSISFQTGNNSRTIQVPDLASVRSAIGELIDEATQQGHNSGSSFVFRKTEAYSLAQASLKMGLSAGYMGTQVRAALSSVLSAGSNSVAAFFKQEMFTITIVQPQTPEALFSNDFTREHLDEQIELGNIGPDNLPVYVSQVVYGRLLMLTATSDSARVSLMSDLEATYDGIGGQISTSVGGALASADVEVVAVGGNSVEVLGDLMNGELHTFFVAEAPLTTAVPIAYTLRNLGDNSVAKVASTTDYVEEVCERIDVNLTTTEASWRDAVLAEQGDQVHEFHPDKDTILKSEEISTWSENCYTWAFQDYCEAGLGPVLTFRGANMTPAMPFDFVLKMPASNGGFTFNDVEHNGLQPYYYFAADCPLPNLSPGDAYQSRENDDIEIVITRVDDDVQITGIAVDIGKNTDHLDEYIEVFGINDTPLKRFQPAAPPPGDPGIWPVGTSYIFTGVASQMPLTRFFFNEGDVDGGNDICIQNIWVSTRPIDPEAP